MESKSCKKCGSQWSSVVKSEFCPFCGSSLREKKNFTKIEDVLSFIFDEYGIDIIKEHGRFISLLGDYAPNMSAERRLIKIAVDANIYKSLLDADSKDAAERNICSKTMVAKLQQEYFLSSEWSEKVVYWFTLCLHWNEVASPSSAIPVPQYAAPVMKSSEEQAGFNPIAYMTYSSDADYVSAKNEECTENFEKAVQLYRKAYNNGNVLAGVKLGILYGTGKGIEESKEKAYQFFTVTQNKGIPLADAWISEYYRCGYAVSKDKEKAAEIFKKCYDALEQMAACGDAEAQYFLGFEYLYGFFIGKDAEKAFKMLNKAYASGKTNAGVELAKCYIEGIGCPADVAFGLDVLEKCAKKTNSKAYYKLGELYYYGDFVKKDYDKAYKYLLNASEKGDRMAMCLLGVCYSDGKGVLKNRDKAIEWLVKAYEKGSIPASSKLGDLYFGCGGSGGEKDLVKAHFYYKYAADKGNIYASNRMAEIYYNGTGVEKDLDKAFSYCKFAADNGSTWAMTYIRKFYLKEEKFKDFKTGLAYLQKAADVGGTVAIRTLGEYYCTGQYGLPKNVAKGHQLFLKAVELGDVFGFIDAALVEKKNNNIAFLADWEYITDMFSKSEALLKNTPLATHNKNLYRLFADSCYFLGVGTTNDDNKALFYNAAASLYQKLYLDFDDSLYDYAWCVFVNAAKPEKIFDPATLLGALEKQALYNKSAEYSKLLFKIYDKGFDRMPFDTGSGWRYLKNCYSIRADKAKATYWLDFANKCS